MEERLYVHKMSTQALLKKNIMKEIQFKGKRIYRNYNQMNIASSKSK